MSESFRFKISVECDVMNADSEAIARTAAFALLTQMQAEKKKGRPSSDAKATITGVSIDQPRFRTFEKTEPTVRSMTHGPIADTQGISDVTE